MHSRGTSVTWTISLALSFLALAFLAAMTGFLVLESIPAFRARGIQVVVDPFWSPPHGRYGALSMIYGTTVVSVIALLVAAPLGILGGIQLSERVRSRWRPWLKAGVELLAGIPSVVYGLVGVSMVSRLVEASGCGARDSLLTAGLLLSVMILPTVLTLTDDALQAVSRPTRDACRALGLDDTATILHGVLPPARAGIAAALLLALGRALGETIAVFLVVGRADNRLPPPRELLSALSDPGQTLTSKLGSTEVFQSFADPEHRSAIVGLALILFVLTALLTWSGRALLRGSEAR